MGGEGERPREPLEFRATTLPSQSIHPFRLRMKKFPMPFLVNLDSATRRARRLDVQFDVGELGSVLRSVRNRDHDSRSEQQHWGYYLVAGLGSQPVPCASLGTTGAMVGVLSSLNVAQPASSHALEFS